MKRRALGLLLLLAACGAGGPVPLGWDEAPCTHCHMTLADRRFGAELVTVRGRILPFDDAGCVAEQLANGVTARGEVSSLWMVDFLHAEKFVAAEEGWFVRSSDFPTPMGSGIVAVQTRTSADSLAELHRGTVLRWDEVVVLAGRGDLRRE